MNKVRASAPQLAGLVPYDPKYLPAEAFLSANENPRDVDPDVRNLVAREIKKVAFNRYPDPLANDLRDMIAEANGLEREQVLMGNGGDELLFDLALAWGGPGRTFLNLPPTFSVYAANARLTGTTVVDIPRNPDFSIDEEAVLDRVAQGDIDFVIVASPNNPTGLMARPEFLERLLAATDALVMSVDANMTSKRVLRVFTPIARASSSPNESTLSFHACETRMQNPTAIGARHMSRSRVLMDANDPMSQNVMVCSLSSASARNFTIDMPDWNKVDTKMPASTKPNVGS